MIQELVSKVQNPGPSSRKNVLGSIFGVFATTNNTRPTATNYHKRQTTNKDKRLTTTNNQKLQTTTNDKQ